jgi:hypothetical protein
MMNITELFLVLPPLLVVIIFIILLGWVLDQIFLKRTKRLNALMVDLHQFQEQGVWQLDAYGIPKFLDQFDMDFSAENGSELILKLKPNVGPITIDLIIFNSSKRMIKKSRYRLQGEGQITIAVPQTTFGLIPVLVADQNTQYEWNLFSIPKRNLNLYAFFSALSLAFSIHFLVQFIRMYYARFTMTCPLCQFQLANELTNVYIVVILIIFVLSFFGIKRVTKILYNQYFNGESTYDFNR